MVERGYVMEGLKYKAFIYLNNNIESYVDEKAFNKVEQIKQLLTKYEGYHCRIVDLSTLDIMLEGAFDDTFLDEEYYR